METFHHCWTCGWLMPDEVWLVEVAYTADEVRRARAIPASEWDLVLERLGDGARRRMEMRLR